MTTMAALMDGVAASLLAATVAPNNYAFPAQAVTVPCTVVGYPTIEYDLTMGRGADTWVVPVWFVVGKANTASSRDKLSAAMIGANSVKTALDGAHSWGDARVMRAEPSEIVIGEATYLASKSECEVYG